VPGAEHVTGTVLGLGTGIGIVIVMVTATATATGESGRFPNDRRYGVNVR